MVCELWCLNILTRSFLFNQSNYLNYINKNSNLFILAYATQEVGKHVSCFPLAYFSCFSCFFRALQKNRALWRLLYLFIMIPNFLTKKIMNLNSGHLRCCLVCKLEVWRRDNSVKEQCFSLFGGESFKASLHLENTVRWVNFLFTLGLFIC